jgi:hypothetical protein
MHLKVLFILHVVGYVEMFQNIGKYKIFWVWLFFGGRKRDRSGELKNL